VFVKLQELLAPWGLTHVYPDDWGTSQSQLRPQQQTIGKEHTPKIARNHLTLRTRITRVTRKTIGFSQSIRMHDIVMGLFVNRYEFGLQL
jgi:insertion element IS1 protein InsB